MGDNILCIDAVFDHQVAERNRTKFGYEPTFLTTRYTTVAKEHYGIEHSLNIVKVAAQFANALKSTQIYYFYVLVPTHFPEKEIVKILFKIINFVMSISKHVFCVARQQMYRSTA